MAGELKVVEKMSLADCFAAALAKPEKAERYTGDPAFKTVAREIKVVWLYELSCCSKQIRNAQSRPFSFSARRLTELRSGNRRGKLRAVRVKIVQGLVEEDYGVPNAEVARQVGISTSGVSKILSRSLST